MVQASGRVYEARGEGQDQPGASGCKSDEGFGRAEGKEAARQVPLGVLAGKGAFPAVLRRLVG